MRDIIIIGSGPAGFTAAIYAARAELKPLLIASSVEIGGELMNTTEVENFPGFPEAVMGPDLMTKMQEQAEKFGTEIVYDDVVELELDGPVKRVKLGNGGVEEARAIVYATGSAYRKLGLPEEATCRVTASRGARRATASSSARRPSRSSAAATRRWRRPPSSPASPTRST